jgi:nucleotide-binding universal stress UspA family protein
MFRRILAGTDGSDTASLALAHAADLAERLNAELTVVTAHERVDSEGGGPASRMSPELVIAGALLRDVEAAYGDRIPLKTRAASGTAADVLVRLADEEQHDLVVVGNRGLNRSSVLEPSSVPGRVTRRSSAAVLVIDTMGSRPPGYRRILAATDGSATAAKAVEAAVGLARTLNADLALATVAASEKDGRRALGALRAEWPDVPVHVLEGDPAGAVCELAQSDRYDLVILGNKGMAGLRRAFGSVPARVLREAPASVLIIRTTG